MSEGNRVIDPEEADILMGYVLEHYVKHHDVVFKKLAHARNATKKSIDEIDAVTENLDTDLPAYNAKEIQAYDLMWKNIIALFRDAGVSEKELVKIEVVLTKIPRLIRDYYDLLVNQDHALQKLMKELQSDEYQKAISITKQMQSKPDLMSGLSSQEFDSKECERSFLFQVPPVKGAFT